MSLHGFDLILSLSEYLLYFNTKLTRKNYSIIYICVVGKDEKTVIFFRFRLFKAKDVSIPRSSGRSRIWNRRGNQLQHKYFSDCLRSGKHTLQL